MHIKRLIYNYLNEIGYYVEDCSPQHPSCIGLSEILFPHPWLSGRARMAFNNSIARMAFNNSNNMLIIGVLNDRLIIDLSQNSISLYRYRDLCNGFHGAIKNFDVYNNNSIEDLLATIKIYYGRPNLIDYITKTTRKIISKELNK